MLRRYVLEASSRRTFPRVTTQIPAFLSSRKALSTVPQENAPPNPGSTGKPPESGSSLSKVVVGTLLGGAAVAAAYQFGYLDQFLSKDKLGLPNKAKVSEIVDAKDFSHVGEKVDSSSTEEPSRVSPNAENAEQKVETPSDATLPEPSSERQEPTVSQVQDKSDVIVNQEEASVPVEEKGVQDKSSVTSEEGLNMESSEAAQPVSTQAASIPGDHETKSLPPQHVVTEDKPENASIEDTEPSTSLLDAYHLKDYEDESVAAEHLVQEKEAIVSATEESAGYLSKDGKLVLDFLQAIHTAEKRQAEIDARVLAEERKALKEKYEKELKDAIAREFMRAEEAAILDKELKRERAKAAAAIKSLQEKAEERLRMELEKKENESEMKLKKVEELAKADLAAKVASEKAAQIEKIAEANLNINALCMAFYARSEEARRSHSAHKLALGALALDDALSKGLPILAEIEALHTYLEGNEKEPILDLVLASLPEETKSHGTDTVLQLNQKFDALKGTLRHFSLLPPGGGGMLAHSLARIASWLKVREADQSGDGIESVINRVESYLAEGKLVEAANALEEGVQGSQAAEVVSVWVTQARNRAIAEQALTLLQSYATSISLS